MPGRELPCHQGDVERPSCSSPRARGDSNPRRIAAIALGAIIGAFIAIGSACSNQGEGERCEVENGNDDCRTEEGLICYPEEQLKNAGSDRCCPIDRSKATNPICKTSVDIGGGDATAPADTGPGPTVDAETPDADTGSPEDASSDADVDANAADQ